MNVTAKSRNSRPTARARAGLDKPAREAPSPPALPSAAILPAPLRDKSPGSPRPAAADGAPLGQQFRQLVNAVRAVRPDADFNAYILGLLARGDTEAALRALTVLIVRCPDEPTFYGLRSTVHEYCARVRGVTAAAERARRDRCKAMVGVEAWRPLLATFEHLLTVGAVDAAQQLLREELDLFDCPAYACWPVLRAAHDARAAAAVVQLMEHAHAQEPGHPSYDMYEHLLGLALMDLQRHDEALVVFNRVCQRSPLVDAAAVDVAAPRALCLAYAGHADRAVAAVRDILKQRVHSGHAWVMLAQAVEQLEDADLLVQVLSCFETNGPPHAAAWKALASGLTSTQRDGEATRAWRRALELDPDDTDAWVRGTSCLLLAGQVDEAVELLQTAARRHGDSLDVWRGLEQALLAQRVANAGVADRGMLRRRAEALRHVVRLQPQAADAWAALGHLQSCLGEHASAIVSLRRACGLAPEHGAHHLSLARACVVARKNLQESRQAFAESMRLDGHDWRAAMELGHLCASQKKPDLLGAVAAYTEASQRLRASQAHIDGSPLRTHLEDCMAQLERLQQPAPVVPAQEAVPAPVAPVVEEAPAAPTASMRVSFTPPFSRHSKVAETVTGVMEGVNAQNYPLILGDNGKRYWCSDPAVLNLRDAHAGDDPLRAVPVAQRMNAPSELAAAFTTLLQTSLGGHTVASVMDAITANTPYRCYLGGGAVRDLVRWFYHDRPRGVPLRAPHDLDLVFTGPPLHAMGVVNRAFAGMTMKSSILSMMHGSLTYTDGNASLDISSVCVANALSKHDWIQGCDDRTCIAAFGSDVQRGAQTRDFLLNTLLYCESTQQVIEPLAGGLADAKAYRLRPASVEALQNYALGLRALKFLPRGMFLDEPEAKLIRTNLQTYLHDPRCVVAGVVRIAPRGLASQAAVEKWVQEDLLAVMRQHRLAKLGHDLIVPHRQRIAQQYAFKHDLA